MDMSRRLPQPSYACASRRGGGSQINHHRTHKSHARHVLDEVIEATSVGVQTASSATSAAFALVLFSHITRSAACPPARRPISSVHIGCLAAAHSDHTTLHETFERTPLGRRGAWASSVRQRATERVMMGARTALERTRRTCSHGEEAAPLWRRSSRRRRQAPGRAAGSPPPPPRQT